MARLVLLTIACLMAAFMILPVAMIGAAGFPLIPLMAFCGVGWVHIALDVADHFGQSAPAPQHGRAPAGLPAASIAAARS